MGRSSSDKRTSTSSSVDNRQLAQDRGAIGGQVGGDQQINVLDGGAIESAERSTGRALSVVDSSNKTAANVSRDALGVGKEAIRSNESTSKSALDTVRRSVGDTLRTVDNTTDRAFASNDDTTRRAFDFGRDSLDSVDKAVGESVQAVTSGTRDALTFADRAGDRAFDFGVRLQDEVTNATRNAFDQTNRAFQGVQQLASNVVRGDSGEVSDTARTALYVAGGLGAAFVIAMMLRSK